MRPAVLISLCLLLSCATPVAPTGGPRDETPPRIVESLPEPEAVNVDRSSVHITFSEYVDEQAFARAFSITPAFSRTPDFAWSGRTVEVRFPESLRENTTYVVSLDTSLRDLHGVALAGPITFAFSTGPTISAGTVAGRVVRSERGRPLPGVDVFAYALADRSAPDTLPARPAYRTQTDQSGAFRFEYLTEQPYFVIALRDQNRNMKLDAQEAFAPPPVPAIPADSTPVDLGLPWILTQIDTTAPEAIRVQSLSRARHRLRFSEPVRFVDRDPDAWTLVDSSSGEQIGIRTVYGTSAEPREVLFTTPDLSAAIHAVTAAALVDTSGNLLARMPVSFTPPASDDTLQTRFLSFLPPRTTMLARGVKPGVRFNAPLDKNRLAETITVSDSVGTPLAYAAVTENGTEYDILPDPAPSPGTRIEIAVHGGTLGDVDSTYAREYVWIPRSETGEISGVVVAENRSDTTGAQSDAPPIIVEASPVDVPVPVPDYSIRAEASGAFMLRDLPAGTYRLRAFVDDDDDGTWDGGLVIPYRSPETMVWREEPALARARWETALPDTLRIPSP